jgi:hypothetical protein
MSTLEIVGYDNIQFTKAQNVLRGMGLEQLSKNEKLDAPNRCEVADFGAGGKRSREPCDEHAGNCRV